MGRWMKTKGFPSVAQYRIGDQVAQMAEGIIDPRRLPGRELRPADHDSKPYDASVCAVTIWMGEARPKPIPYTPVPVHVHQMSRRINMKEGVKLPINRFAWITDGPLRPLERGLVMAIDVDGSAEYDCLPGVPVRLRELEKDLMTAAGAETAPTPRPITPRERPKSLQAKRKPVSATGISPVPPQQDIADSIGRVQLQSLKVKVKRPEGVSPFPHLTCRPQQAKRPQSTVQLVRAQLQRVFKPGEEAFTNVDRAEDFPTDGLEALMASAETETASEHEKVDLNDFDAPSTLIDTSDHDIFWTRQLAPFTREETDTLYAWRKQCHDHQAREQAKVEKMLREREDCIRQTFQSKLALDRGLELVDRACREVANVGVGKQVRHRESIWKMAARVTRSDPSSLPFRREKWMKFVDFVKRYGGVRDPLQKKFVEAYRSELMSGRKVSSQIFWNILDLFDEMELIKTTLIEFLDHLRREMGISREATMQYFREHGTPTHFFEMFVRFEQAG
jgi:hypothetical protein